MSKQTPAAEAAEAEANGSRRTFQIGDVVLDVPRKWKRMKFLRLLNSGDLWGAMAIVFGEEQVELLEDIELDGEEFQGIAERLGEILGGTTSGN